MTPAFESIVSRIRRFNRFYTRTIGLLDETLADSAFTLTEARVLFELGAGDDVAAVQIARDLALDPAYLARILKAFRKAGLLTAEVGSDDRRRRTLALTDRGKAALAELQAAADRDISRLIAPLIASNRQQLTAAMAAIETVLTEEPGDAGVALRPYRIGDIGWVIERQARLYADEYGWNDEYEALVAEIGAAFIRNFRPGKEFCWIAEKAGERVGAVFLVRKSDEDGQLRLLHVEREARGLGVGAQLVAECVATARRAGYRKLVLWTNDVLIDARRLYERAGFSLAAEERHHSFGKDLVGQNWELVL